MKILLLVAIFIFLYTFLRLFKNKKFLKNKKITSFNKNNLYDWMNLTRKERYDLSEKDSDNYFNKRRVLLDQIQKEYKSIHKNQQKNP
tara:strand:- start:137 stop:400 length:264 start_codon:yes stop_codon:yes gene_type:complete